VAEVVGVESREASKEDRERWATLKRAAEAAAEKRELGLALLQELELVVASLRRRYRGDDVAVASASREGATRARAIWGRARELGPEDAHPYLSRKQVQAHGVRLMAAEGGDVLVIPMRDLGGRLVGLQFIGPDGVKKILTGAPKRGAVHWIGPAVTADPVLVDVGDKGKRLVLPDPPKIVAVGEGYATVATVCEALGWDGAVAFDCGNLATVAAGVAYRWPSAWVVVLGDWDCNEDQEPGDPGVSAAVAAAEACGGVAIWPQVPGGLGWDWNDVLVRDSEEVLRELLAARLAAARAGMGPREREAARRARVLLAAWYGATGAA
jgi:putative DNA primase/helicase